MIISWNITRRCNLFCKHCYRDAGKAGPDELTTGEGKRLIDEIAAAGFKILILSGGEPLLRGDIYDLTAHAAARGLRPVLGTNGTLLDRAVAQKLKASGLARAGISVDSLDPAEHDGFRGVAGSWRRTLDALRACREEGLSFQVHTTATRRNAADIGALTRFAEENGAAAHHVFFLVPTGRGGAIGESVLAGAEYHAVVRALAHGQRDCGIELKAVCAPQFASYCLQNGIDTRFRKGCLAGISYCCILPEGDVHPCPYLPVKAGNVRDMPFDRLWKESSLFNELRTQRYKGRCGTCAYRQDCGGCRARAFHARGDYLHEDPLCFASHGPFASREEVPGADTVRQSSA